MSVIYVKMIRANVMHGNSIIAIFKQLMFYSFKKP